MPLVDPLAWSLNPKGSYGLPALQTHLSFLERYLMQLLPYCKRHDKDYVRLDFPIVPSVPALLSARYVPKVSLPVYAHHGYQILLTQPYPRYQ